MRRLWCGHCGYDRQQSYPRMGQCWHQRLFGLAAEFDDGSTKRDQSDDIQLRRAPNQPLPQRIVHFINCVAEGPAPGVTPNGAGTLTNPNTGFNNSNTWDIYVWFDPTASNFTQSNGTQIGGRNHRRTASSAFCAANGYTYPCGAKCVWRAPSDVDDLNQVEAVLQGDCAGF